MTTLLRPAYGLLSGCLFFATISGCMMASVKELPPPNYSIEGVWELNAALSTDPNKALESVQARDRDRMRGGPGGPGDPGGAAPVEINDPTTDLPPIDTSPDHGRGGWYGSGQNERNMYRAPLDFQNNALLGGQWLKIHQTDSEMQISNAASNRTFTPGERSVVSVTSGVADQVAGWSGRNFLIQVRPQIGPQVEETYTLSPDGRQLLVKIDVASEGRNAEMKVSRVYDRSNRDPATLKQTLMPSLPPADE